MPAATTTLAPFFAAFDRNCTAGDFPALISQFADVFMAAGPDGTQAVRIADFALALPKRKQLFDALGCTSAALASLEETPLDDRFMLARTKWRMTFAPAGRAAQDIVASSTFIVDTGTETPRIILYLHNQDLMQVLRERGIAPA